jgi:hypothetical protein
MDEQLARMRTHRNNILRYRNLLATKLMEHERQYILRRLSEEQSALEALTDPSFPLYASGVGRQLDCIILVASA